MGVEATGAGGATGAARGAAPPDIAGALLAANRMRGALDTVSLAAAVTAQAASDPAETARLTTALDAAMSPVERGQFAAALHATDPAPTPPPSQEGIGSFFEGAFAGDLSSNDSWSKTAGQVVMGFVPVAGQIADVRDMGAAVGQIVQGKSGGWANLATSAIGIIPGVGDAAKGLLRGGEKVADAGGDIARATAKHGDDVARAGEKVAVRSFTSAADFNAAANHALPNTRYEFGSYAYTTDAGGRVSSAEGQISLAPAGRNDNALQTQIGHEGKPTDVGFHLIADRFGAQTNRLNVVPGNGKPIGDGLPNLNTGAYKRFENTVADIAAQPGNRVEVKIRAEYGDSNATNRPDQIIGSYRVNGGKWREQSFVNK
ncbi:DNA/RNA non-specific endonuclease [Sphingomonas sp. RB3P16]|uniref:DNA/RNA non-specific endonuclease n=1 Tax=Parasphingomonas frigoris TaxID=3096163 RepID=UPI002FCACAFB